MSVQKTKAEALDKIRDRLLRVKNWPSEKVEFAEWVDQLISHTYYGDA